ncbi:hypothetical protein ANN_06417 [Periplaneta americana]|uniref:Uncharacterized protein n=1 Tax=Periplaneta americana TaxID=6978 RepID=A0ABQ8TER9_PERAM|nr:hypothetical protein ANN_06417 [Periplaneta americana]
MSPGSSTESYPAFSRIGLRKNPGKNLNQVTCLVQDSNLGHLVSRPDALNVTPQVWTVSPHVRGACGSLYFACTTQPLLRNSSISNYPTLAAMRKASLHQVQGKSSSSPIILAEGTSSKTYGCTSNLIPTGRGHSPYSRNSMQVLKEISRFGDINWPAWSPDLSAPDYFLCGYLKIKESQGRPHTLQHFKKKIETEIQKIPWDKLQNVMDNVRRSAEICFRSAGAHKSKFANDFHRYDLLVRERLPQKFRTSSSSSLERLVQFELIVGELPITTGDDSNDRSSTASHVDEIDLGRPRGETTRREMDAEGYNVGSYMGKRRRERPKRRRRSLGIE